MYKKVVYPGTFDPITNGHMDIIKRAKEIFGHVIVAISTSESKNPYFNHAQRIKMAKEATKDIGDIEVVGFDCLLVDFAKKNDVRIIIRGLRAVSDFEYELQMGYANASLWDKIETIYLMPSLKNAFISSSIIRTILKYNDDVKHLVPQQILKYLGADECM